MRKTARIIALLLLTAALLSCFSGCATKASKIKDTLSEFEYACRTLDVDAILDVIDPSVADPIRLTIAILSSAAGQDYEDVTDGILEELIYGVFGEDYDPDEFLSTLSISDAKVETTETGAVVTCLVNFEIAGERFEQFSTIVMREVNEKWYIASIDIFS